MTTEERDQEVAELRERLDEAEETLRAIYQGAVDALVVRGPHGPQVFTLRGAQEPYRVLVERMNEGAITVSDEGVILYSNRHFADLVEKPLEQIVGKPFTDFIAPQDRSAVAALLIDGAQRSVRRELTLLRGDRATLPTLAAAGPMPVDETAALLLIITDLTAQKHSEEIAAAERFARSILEQATDAVLVCDRAGRITQASWAAERLIESPLIGEVLLQAVPLELASRGGEGTAGERGSTAAFLQSVLAVRSFHGVEARIASEELADRHFLLSAGPLHDHSADSIGCILTLTDITERKRAEEHQTMLVAELNHRVKNILAIVQSVAWQTLSNSGSLSGFKSAFDGRLRAISIAHDVLTQIRWGYVELQELLAQALAPYRASEPPKVTWSGPSLMLPAHSVVPLSMVLHELSTNAAKYGALANDAGTVAVDWRLINDRRDVEVAWIERDGPPVEKKVSEGFGSKLITRVITYDLNGRVDLKFAPEGFRCTLTFPVPAERGQALEPASAARASG